MSQDPQPPVLKASNYDESATFGDLTAVFKWVVENHVRFSLSSPPLLKDVKEGTVVIDKAASPPRIYTTLNGALYYVALTAA